MPYIKQSRRKDIANGDSPQNCGELNYAFTKAMIGVMNNEVDKNIAREELRQAIISLANIYVQIKGVSYQTINDVNGAITCASMEFARRIGEYPEWVADALVDVATAFYFQTAAPYEDKKILDNGDVYV